MRVAVCMHWCTLHVNLLSSLLFAERGRERAAQDRVPEGHRGALPALLARQHRARHQVGPACAHGRARQHHSRGGE